MCRSSVQTNPRTPQSKKSTPECPAKDSAPLQVPRFASAAARPQRFKTWDSLYFPPADLQAKNSAAISSAREVVKTPAMIAIATSDSPLTGRVVAA
jgi:hypothetical protein